MKKLGLTLLALGITSAMFATSPVEAKDKPLPKMINVHDLCNDPEMAVAVVSQMCANTKVRTAIAKELKQHKTFNEEYMAANPGSGG